MARQLAPDLRYHFARGHMLCFTYSRLQGTPGKSDRRGLERQSQSHKWIAIAVCFFLKPKSIKFAQVIITKRDAIGQFGEISLLCRAVGRMTAGMQS